MKTDLILEFKQNLFSKVIWSSTFKCAIIITFPKRCLKLKVSKMYNQHLIIVFVLLQVTKAGLPSGVSDIWELCGKPNDAKFTWDTSVNDNLGLPFAAKCRFDRLYLRQGSSTELKLAPKRFSLIGKKRLPGCHRFPSDHWGIVCDFKVEQEK